MYYIKYIYIYIYIYIQDGAFSNNSNDLQVLTFVTKGSILDAASALSLPMSKIEENKTAHVTCS